ncbi:MAG: hypothetical protein RL062_1096 [Bacteroidota bacterium]|jgi:hypothetical integral membrane protein (TIGR02206 family)
MNYRFPYWELEHWLIISLTMLLPIGSILWAKNASQENKDRLGRFLGAMLVINWIAYQSYRVYSGYWSVQYDLPLELCNWAIFFTAIALWTKKQQIAELAYFWVMSGSIHGVITPDIHEPFPHFTYITFMIGHTGLVWSVLYLVGGLKVQPTRGSVWRALGYSQIYFIVAIAVNYFLNSNYGYLREKPVGGSFLDILHPWPYYLIELEFIGILSYTLVYLPFWWIRRKQE